MPGAERSRWSTGAVDGAIDLLKTAMAAWYASAGLSRDGFRDRFLDPSTPDKTVDDLREAARGTVDGSSYDELAEAGDHLAAAARSLGPDRWPRFVGGAARKALAAVDAGSVPGVTKASAADTELGLLLLGGLAIGGAIFLHNQKPTAPSTPPPVIPSIVENRRPPSDAKDPNGAKAPGKPGDAEGFKDPKDGEQWVPNPNGRGFGWLDSKGNVWVPTGLRPGNAHGGPHWDVQYPNGRKDTNYPGGKVR